MFSPQDKVRTESYRDFMYRNPEVFRDKVSRLNKYKQTSVCVCVFAFMYVRVQVSWWDVQQSPSTEIACMHFAGKTLIRPMASDLKHYVTLLAPRTSAAVN